MAVPYRSSKVTGAPLCLAFLRSDGTAPKMWGPCDHADAVQVPGSAVCRGARGSHAHALVGRGHRAWICWACGASWAISRPVASALDFHPSSVYDALVNLASRCGTRTSRVDGKVTPDGATNAARI